jgi:predicted phosphodiesterase
MRILHLADLHFDLEHYAWLEAQASEYDLVIIAGDLLERYASDTPVPMQQQL